VPKKPTRNHVADLRGASRLAVEATARVTDVVEAMHNTIGGGPAVLGGPLARPMRLLNGPAYGHVRAVARVVGAGIEPVRPRLSVVPVVDLRGCGRVSRSAT